MTNGKSRQIIRGKCATIVWTEKILTAVMQYNSRKYLHFPDLPPASLPRSDKNKKYLLYLHIPFCEKLCSYCSFHRVPYEAVLTKKYFKALRQEITLYRDLGYDCVGVYIGGGTPTISLDELNLTIELIRSLFSIKEISLETNPNHLQPNKIEALKQMKINRLSVGVQSFDDTILRSIGRYEHYGSGAEIKEKLIMIQGAFTTVNLDMIFNFPNQTEEMLAQDLEVINQLKTGQVTFYPLMVSNSNSYDQSVSLGAVDYRREKQYYAKILEKLSGHYVPATAWCFSRSRSLADEYIVNQEEYIGLGSGSFSLLNGAIKANTFSLNTYVSELEKGKLPVRFSRQFSEPELMRYDFLMKLFSGQLDIDLMNSKYEGNFSRSLASEIYFFKMIGVLEKRGNILFLTSKGRYYWVIMMREFFIGVNNFRVQCLKES